MRLAAKVAGKSVGSMQFCITAHGIIVKEYCSVGKCTTLFF